MRPSNIDELIFNQILRVQNFTKIPMLNSTREILYDDIIVQHISNMVADVDGFRKKDWSYPHELGLYRITLFSLARSLKPNLIVETGVLHGFTSLSMLWALKKNRTGRLISIDLPSPFGSAPANKDGYLDTLPLDCESGWLVGKKFDEYWDLRIGSSQSELKKLPDKKLIDIFVHDSEHTYQNMLAELNSVWGKLKPGAEVIVDNADANTALSDFSIDADRTVLYLPSGPSERESGGFKTRVGILVK